MRPLPCAHALILALLLPLDCLAAPVPAPRPKPAAKAKAPAHVGNWSMTWGLYAAPTAFGADGSYSCWWMGEWWVGTWTLANGKLTVVEQRAPGLDGRPDEPLEWTVALDQTGLAGRLSAGHGAFRLEAEALPGRVD